MADFDVRGDAVFNHGQGDNDFRVSGQTKSHLLFVDARSWRVGLGTSAPSQLLDVRGSAMFNKGKADKDFRVESRNRSHMLFVDAGKNAVAIGGTGVPATGDNLDVRGSALFNGGKASYDFRVASDRQSHMLFVDASSDRVGIGTSTPGAMLDVRGSAFFNIGQADADFRVASDGQSHMLFVDASSDHVGIKTSTPAATLDVNGAAIFNDGKGNNDFDIKGNFNTVNTFFVDASKNRIGIGTTSPSTRLHVGSVGAATATFTRAGTGHYEQVIAMASSYWDHSNTVTKDQGYYDRIRLNDHSGTFSFNINRNSNPGKDNKKVVALFEGSMFIYKGSLAIATNSNLWGIF